MQNSEDPAGLLHFFHRTFNTYIGFMRLPSLVSVQRLINWQLSSKYVHEAAALEQLIKRLKRLNESPWPWSSPGLPIARSDVSDFHCKISSWTLHTDQMWSLQFETPALRRPQLRMNLRTPRNRGSSGNEGDERVNPEKRYVSGWLEGNRVHEAIELSAYRDRVSRSSCTMIYYRANPGVCFGKTGRK